MAYYHYNIFFLFVLHKVSDYARVFSIFACIDVFSVAEEGDVEKLIFSVDA